MTSDLDNFHRLYKAVSNDELQLQFQPVVDSRQRHLAGFEALVRWYDPGSGRMVPPAEFLPFAEQTGLIVYLGEKILDDACREARLWNRLGSHTRSVSVNIAARQLQDSSFPDVIFDTVARHKLETEALRLEFPQAALSGEGAILDKLQALKARGIKLALNDFGRGVSSVHMLHQFPFDLIKLERSFLLDMEQDDDSRTLAGGIAAIVHELGKSLAVVGIETEQQAQIATTIGADFLQGYLFGKPAAANQFKAL